MIHFVWPWLLLLLPLPLVVRRWLPKAEPSLAGAIRLPFCAELMVLQQEAGGTTGRRLLLPWLTWVLLVLAVARPVWVGEDQPRLASGRDLMLLVDVSGSMRQMDFAREGEQLDRLDLVKESALRFLEGRAGDRVGLILFGSRPHLRAPPTWDHAALRQLVEEAEIALAGESTAIGDAVGLAIKHLRELDARSRVVVLITDGANNEGNIDPRQAARLAAAEGIRIYTIGIGRPETPAPNPWSVWSTEGSERFEKEVLTDMAALTGGRFLHALDARALDEALQTIDQLEPALDQGQHLHLALPLHPWLLGAALFLGLWQRWREG